MLVSVQYHGLCYIVDVLPWQTILEKCMQLCYQAVCVKIYMITTQHKSENAAFVSWTGGKQYMVSIAGWVLEWKTANDNGRTLKVAVCEKTYNIEVEQDERCVVLGLSANSLGVCCGMRLAWKIMVSKSGKEFKN